MIIIGYRHTRPSPILLIIIVGVSFNSELHITTVHAIKDTNALQYMVGRFSTFRYDIQWLDLRTVRMRRDQWRHFNFFLVGQIFFYFSMPPNYWKIRKNSTLYVIIWRYSYFPSFFISFFFFFFSLFSLFSFFLSFFLFPWGGGGGGGGGDGPQPPQMTPLDVIIWMNIEHEWIWTL